MHGIGQSIKELKCNIKHNTVDKIGIDHTVMLITKGITDIVFHLKQFFLLLDHSEQERSTAKSKEN